MHRMIFFKISNHVLRNAATAEMIARNIFIGDRFENKYLYIFPLNFEEIFEKNKYESISPNIVETIQKISEYVPEGYFRIENEDMLSYSKTIKKRVEQLLLLVNHLVLEDRQSQEKNTLIQYYIKILMNLINQEQYRNQMILKLLDTIYYIHEYNHINSVDNEVKIAYMYIKKDYNILDFDINIKVRDSIKKLNSKLNYIWRYLDRMINLSLSDARLVVFGRDYSLGVNRSNGREGEVL